MSQPADQIVTVTFTKIGDAEIRDPDQVSHQIDRSDDRSFAGALQELLKGETH